MASACALKSSDENGVLAEKDELPGGNYLCFDDKKQMYTRHSDIEALTELRRQDLGMESFKVHDSVDQSVSLRAKSVTFTPYKSTKSLQIKGWDALVVKTKIWSLLQLSGSAQRPQTSQISQGEDQISHLELDASPSTMQEEESPAVADNTDHEQLITNHWITKELGDMKQEIVKICSVVHDTNKTANCIDCGCDRQN